MGCCKEEFQLKKFGFGDEKSYKFSLSGWQWSYRVFIGWRVFWALWHIGWLIRSFQYQVATYENGWKWFIFFTNWSYLALTFQSVIALILVIYNTRNGRKTEEDFGEESNTNWSEKMLWFFTTISFDAAIVVTAVYWTFVFKELKKALSVITHAVTTFYALSDIMISATPIRFLHFIYSSIFIFSYYFLFSLFYHLAGGTNNEGEPYVYETVDWSKTGTTIITAIVVSFAGAPLVHLINFGIYKLRVCKSHCCGCGSQPNKGEEDTERA